MSAGAGPDILDSEMLLIEELLMYCHERAQNWPSYLDRGHLDKEFVERFYDLGWRVTVTWERKINDGHFDPTQAKVVHPTININGRVDEKEFDHEKMSFEVTSDILGLGHGGVIKTTKEDLDKIHGVEQGHKHGSGCGH